MSITGLLTRACLIVRPGASADTYDAEPGAETSVQSFCDLQQEESSEGFAGELQITVWRVFLLPDADVQGGDHLVVDGARYDLLGDPWPVWNPLAAAVSHVEARARRES